MTMRHMGMRLAVLLGAILVFPVWGADFNMAVKTEGIQMGKSIMGPTHTSDDLKGKVVFIEFWGIN